MIFGLAVGLGMLLVRRMMLYIRKQGKTAYALLELPVGHSNP